MKTTLADILRFPTGRRYFYPAAAAVAALVCLAAFLALSGMTAEARKDADRLAGRLAKVAPLVEELETLQGAEDESLAPMEPLAAAQQISRDLGLAAKLSSVRPINVTGERTGVQVYYESLNLDQLVELLRTLKSRGGLKIVSFALNRRMDDPELANLQMVLGR
jgi:hypothetical protein